jgi:ABC-type multidrug transport system fused ATPase/permease subunit
MLKSAGGAAAWERQRSGSGDKCAEPKQENDAKASAPASGEAQSAEKGSLVRKEAKREGAVTLATVRHCIDKLGGYPVFVCMVMSSWLFHLSELGPDVFLASWQDGNIAASDTACLGTWLALGCLGVGATVFSRMVWALSTSWAAGRAHCDMLRRVLHCPTKWFDRTPSGRIMNRLGEDQMMCDWTVALWSEVFFITLWQVVDMVSMVIVARPLMAPFIVVYLGCYMVVREVHRRSMRETIRWWMVTKSPVFSLLEEWFSGAATIHAFGREAHFGGRFQSALSANMEWILARDSSNLWTEQRHGWIGAFVLGTLAVMMLLRPSSGASPALAAVSIIQALLLSQALKTVSNMMVQVEGCLGSVERVVELANTPEQEPPWRLPGDADRELRGWPGKDSGLAFEKVSVRYSQSAPRALDCFSAAFEAREKIGIVGRTGSGKSTLVGVIFRLFDLEDGRVLLDGVDISEVGLAQLRGKITIVPQDPILFSGTLRKNLDPLGVRSDEAISQVLRQCSIMDLVSGMSGGLEATVSAGGSNFSLGERQVLCLARALLRRTRVLCLDEATANVDPVNDQRIQHILQEEMQDILVLTIAHRLHTVMHSDRILVLDAGRLSQLDAPGALLEQPGIFKSLAEQAGIRRQVQNGATLPDDALGA